jgi:hypothetical protein
MAGLLAWSLRAQAPVPSTAPRSGPPADAATSPPAPPTPLQPTELQTLRLQLAQRDALLAQTRYSEALANFANTAEAIKAANLDGACTASDAAAGKCVTWPADDVKSVAFDTQQMTFAIAPGAKRKADVHTAPDAATPPAAKPSAAKPEAKKP